MQESCRQGREFRAFRLISCSVFFDGLIFINIFEWLVFLNLVLLGVQCLLEVNVNVAEEKWSVPVNILSLDELPGEIHWFDNQTAVVADNARNLESVDISE